MNRGVPSLEVSVVPDSGTEGLLGLVGSLQIDVVEGTRKYTLTYEIA
jgi:hypothetical protein